MYTVPQSEQLFIFLCSLGLGFIIGVFYDVFRAVRLSITKSKVAIVVFDILFFVFGGIFTFLFTLAFNKGEIRFYIFAGELIGMAFYYFSFGIVAIKITDILVKLLHKIYSFIFSVISFPFRLLQKLFSALKEKFLIKFKKTKKNSEKIQKKHLPKLRLYVYNLFGVLLIKPKNKAKGGNGNGKKHKEKKEKLQT